MSADYPYEVLFLAKLQEARATDALLDAACKKVVGKLEEYALSRGTKPEALLLPHVCDAGGELHPQLRLFIETIPQLKKQTDARYEKYKQEISAHAQRAIDAVIFLVTGVRRGSSTDAMGDEASILLRDEHPVLKEIYALLPRERGRSLDNTRFQSGDKISENGCFFYFSCAEALKHCSPVSLQEFLQDHRSLLRRSFKTACAAFPEKIGSLDSILDKMCKRLGIERPKRRKTLPLSQWPSPLREEVEVYKEAIHGNLVEGLDQQLADAEVNVKLQGSIRPATYRGCEATVERLMFRYFPDAKTLSIRDFLSTTETKSTGPNGKEKSVYFNRVLSPLRESEKTRSSDFKGAKWDSKSFVLTKDRLLSLAAYNGIFEYHEIIRRAFKAKTDPLKEQQRKDEKKKVINRQGLDKWLEDNFPKYENILKQGLFKRDRSKRKHKESDKNMRFVLHYKRLATMKKFGYRQRQLRDCKDGVNLIVTKDSLEFNYSAEQMKKDAAYHFEADSEGCEKTHGPLIKTLYLYRKYAFPYVQANPDTWPKDRPELDPRGQWFVVLHENGKFARFDPDNASSFTAAFKSGCRKFLKHPELLQEAALLIHPHHVRGAAMDAEIVDEGMPMPVASDYFAVSERVINRKYKDRKATRDASRAVKLMNIDKMDLEERQKRNRRPVGATTESGVEKELLELRRQLSESREREKQYQEREKQYQEREKQYQEREKQYQESGRQKDLRIAGLEQSLTELEADQDKKHEELMDAVSNRGNGAGDSEHRKRSSGQRFQQPQKT